MSEALQQIFSGRAQIRREQLDLERQLKENELRQRYSEEDNLQIQYFCAREKTEKVADAYAAIHSYHHPRRKTAAESSIHFSVLYSCLSLSFTPLQDRVTAPQFLALLCHLSPSVRPSCKCHLKYKKWIFGTKLWSTVKNKLNHGNHFPESCEKSSACILKLLFLKKVIILYIYVYVRFFSKTMNS